MTNRERLQEYKEKNFCLDIQSIKVGRLNINWVLQMNSKHAPTEKDKYSRQNSKQREQQQIKITTY
jgi:hypothetical protein